MHRIHVELELRPGEERELPAAAAHHVRSVLRLARDAAIVLFNGGGGEFTARLTAVSRTAVRAAVGEAQPGIPEPPFAITLVQAVSRGERMDYTLQKAVELGVARIVPVVSRRTVVRLDDERGEKRLQHWRGIVRHAAEQSGRTIVPSLAPLVPLATWVATHEPGTAFLLDPRAATSLAGHARPAAATIVAGPEGGFDPAERELMVAAGIVPVRLGPRILRTETAALAALTVMQTRWGDLA
jgi:16S rRNA (uracil1498-N3)-methyltransferase